MTMTKNTLLIAFLVVALVLFFWLYKTNNFLKVTAQSAIRQFEPVQTQVLSPPATAPKAPASLPNLNQRQNEIRILQQRLNEERSRLETRSEELNQLKTRKNEQEREAAISFTNRIAINNTQIQNLTDILEDQRLAEEDVNQAATAALREQTIAAQAARDQIDQNIQLVEQSIQQTQEQIVYWTTYQINITEQQAQLQNLRNQLETQRQQLNALRAQKASVSSQVLAQAQNINNTAQQQQADLVGNQDSIQAQISSLREDNVRLQTNQARVQMSLKTLNSQVSEAQQAFDDQSQTVQGLEESLRRKQRDLGQSP